MHTGTVNTARWAGTKSLTVPILVIAAAHKAGGTPLLCMPKAMKLETPHRIQKVGADCHSLIPELRCARKGWDLILWQDT
jgi:hypothetical protein